MIGQRSRTGESREQFSKKMFWRSNNDQSKRMNNFYPKGLKVDFCTIPSFSTIEKSTKVDLGYCGNTRWSLEIEKKNDKITARLECEPARKSLTNFENWSVNADVMIRFLNQKNNEKSLTASGFDVSFNRKEGGGNQWNQSFENVIINEKNGFEMHGDSIFQVQIGIVKLEEIFSGNFIDFSIPRPGDSDTVLSVENRKFHVSKQILSLHSPFFRAMFHGNFNESGMSEIPINNVELNTFHIFLQYIYMAPIEICEENVSQLLLMGDQFVVKKLKRECENFLMRKDINEKDAIDLAIFHSLDRVLCQKIMDKSTEDLAIWWSLGQNLPESAMKLLTERLENSPKPILKDDAPKPVPVEKKIIEKSETENNTSVESSESEGSEESEESEDDTSESESDSDA